GLHYVFQFVSSLREGAAGERLREIAVAGASTVVLLLPWMWLMLRSSGTLLFPVFGVGYHGDRYGWPAVAGSPSRAALPASVVYVTASRSALAVALALLTFAQFSGLRGPSQPRRV